jgi:hypothetical protein
MISNSVAFHPKSTSYLTLSTRAEVDRLWCTDGADEFVPWAEDFIRFIHDVSTVVVHEALQFAPGCCLVLKSGYFTLRAEKLQGLDMLWLHDHNGSLYHPPLASV